MSDELIALIASLEKEVLPLEHELRAREAEEERNLRAAEARIAAAQARMEKAEATLKVEAAQLAVLAQRRAELLAIAKSWRGQLWGIGYGTVAMGALLAAVAAFPIVARWYGGSAALGVLAAQAVAFGVLWFVIPKKT